MIEAEWFDVCRHSREFLRLPQTCSGHWQDRSCTPPAVSGAMKDHRDRSTLTSTLPPTGSLDRHLNRRRPRFSWDTSLTKDMLLVTVLDRVSRLYSRPGFRHRRHEYVAGTRRPRGPEQSRLQPWTYAMEVLDQPSARWGARRNRLVLSSAGGDGKPGQQQRWR